MPCRSLLPTTFCEPFAEATVKVCVLALGQDRPDAYI
jgi:hypothetical protein